MGIALDSTSNWRMRHTYAYLVVMCPRLLIIRIPEPWPRWRRMLKALTPVMRSYGLRQKDIVALESLFPAPFAEDWTQEQQVFLLRVEQAYQGSPVPVCRFDLYAWDNDSDSFHLVRKGTP